MKAVSQQAILQNYQWIQKEVLGEENCGQREHIQRLQEKGKAYMRKRELEKNRRVEMEMDQAPFSPLINKPREGSREKVENRLLVAGQRYKQRQEVLRKNDDQEQADQSINMKKVKRRSSVQSRLLTAQAVYYNRSMQRAQQQIEDELSEVKNPKLCGNSLKILAAKNRSGSIEKRLIEHGKKAEKAKKLQKLINDFEISQKAKPQITKTAQELKRSGSVTDRLMNYKAYYQHHKQTLSEVFTQNQTFTPDLSLSKSRERISVDRTQSVDRRKCQNYIQPEHTFRPELNQKSRKILEKKGYSSFSQLLAPKLDIEMPQEERYPFKPLVNFKSQLLDRRRDMGQDRNQALYALSKVEKKVQQVEVDLNCTFQPLISKTVRSPSKKDQDRFYEKQTQ